MMQMGAKARGRDGSPRESSERRGPDRALGHTNYFEVECLCAPSHAVSLAVPPLELLPEILLSFMALLKCYLLQEVLQVPPC